MLGEMIGRVVRVAGGRKINPQGGMGGGRKRGREAEERAPSYKRRKSERVYTSGTSTRILRTRKGGIDLKRGLVTEGEKEKHCEPEIPEGELLRRRAREEDGKLFSR